MQCRNLGARNYYQAAKPKYSVRNIPDNFMASDNMCNVISQLIEDINLTRENNFCILENKADWVGCSHIFKKPKFHICKILFINICTNIFQVK